MNYTETISYLYELLPVFHREGKKAFKADLANTIALCEYLGNPEKKFKSIHIAGTNGKGSSSHFFASILQAAGYKVGLYTSPHLKSYTERFRINGVPIAENRVVEFVSKHRSYIETLQPSFFELSVGLAFDFFAEEQVDVAVIEVGLGGRLDSTNVITPELCLITNIGFDHTDILGDTLDKIAFEKAGIMKSGIPVVISEYLPHTAGVFVDVATERKSPLYFASDFCKILNTQITDKGLQCQIRVFKEEDILIISELTGKYQTNNIVGVLSACMILKSKGWEIPYQAVVEGFAKVITQTGLKGRWQKLGELPTIICDTAHNVEGFKEILESLTQYTYPKLWMVLGFVSDKDVTGILKILPTSANYIFCQAQDSPRAMPAFDLYTLASQFGLNGQVCANVNEALHLAKKLAQPTDFIYVGGSTFVVAEIEDL